MRKNVIKKEQILLFVIFFIFLFLRVFSDSPYFLIKGSDYGRYLELAKNFPHHTLDNNQLFLYHRPLYPYMVHFLTWFFEDHIAGIMVSLISSIASFFILYKLVLHLTKEKYIALGSLILFSLSRIHVITAKIILVESFSVMLTLGSIYFYILFLEDDGKKYLWLSAIFGALLAMTTDLALLLIIGLAAIYIFLGKKKQIWRQSIPILATTISYLIWMLIRMYYFLIFEYYPAAINGTIVRVSEWSLMSLISTDNFREIALYMSTILPIGINLDPLNYIYPLIYMFSLIIAPFHSGLRFSNVNILFNKDNLPQLFIYSLLFIGAAYGMYKIIKMICNKKIKKNGILMVFSLLLIFLLPLVQRINSTRYQITAIVFLIILINYGFFQLAKKLNILRTYNGGIIFVIIFLIVYLPFYYAENNHFVLSQQKVVEAAKTAEFINRLPKDGVMAQIGYTPELNYLSDKRVMALPIHPDYMFLIDMYEINYLIYGGFDEGLLSEKDTGKVFNYDTIKYIREHPEKFRLLATIEESYPEIEINDHLQIYEVIRK